MNPALLLTISFLSASVIVCALIIYVNASSYETWGNIQGNIRENIPVYGVANPEGPGNMTFTYPLVGIKQISFTKKNISFFLFHF